jgi:hypothetical protein
LLASVPKRSGSDMASIQTQVADFIALRGDPSDKLSGAVGVGAKRAAQMVRQYGSLDGVLDAGLFLTEAKIAPPLSTDRHGCISPVAVARQSGADNGPQHRPLRRVGD